MKSSRVSLFVVSGNYVQKNELAAVVENCWCVAQDAAKIFAAYWYLGVPQTPVPAVWPPDYDTTFNRHTPMTVRLNSTTSAVYVAVGSLHCVTSRSVLQTDPRDVLPTSTLINDRTSTVASAVNIVLVILLFYAFTFLVVPLLYRVFSKSEPGLRSVNRCLRHI